jgi:hypothetical protein
VVEPLIGSLPNVQQRLGHCHQPGTWPRFLQLTLNFAERLQEVMLSVYGQVVHRRRLSSRLLFYDLLLVDEDPAVIRAMAADDRHNAERESPEAVAEFALLKQAAQGVELMIKADGHTKGRMPLEAVRGLQQQQHCVHTLSDKLYLVPSCAIHIVLRRTGPETLPSTCGTTYRGLPG